jgi:aryl-alcohol dehydrogenase-like predicted oxidoreductase
MQQLKQEGEIRSFGISLYGTDFLRESIHQWQPDVVQIHFNLFSQGASAAFPEAIAAGVGLMARRPLDAGMLGGDLVVGAPVKLGDPRPRWGVDLTERRQKLLDELRFLTECTGRTWAQAALQFTLSFDAISTAIPSTISTLHLQENVAAAGGRLSTEELRRIDELLAGEFPGINLGY